MKASANLPVHKIDYFIYSNNVFLYVNKSSKPIKDMYFEEYIASTKYYKNHRNDEEELDVDRLSLSYHS